MDRLPEELRQEVIRSLAPSNCAQLHIVNKYFYTLLRQRLLKDGWFKKLKIQDTDISAMLKTDLSECIKEMTIKLEPECTSLDNFLALRTVLERPACCIIKESSEIGEWGNKDKEMIWKANCTLKDISPPTASAPSALPALQEIQVLVEGPRMREMSLALIRTVKGIKELSLTASYFWLPAEEIWPSLEILKYETTEHDRPVPEGSEESKLQDSNGTHHDLQRFIKCQQKLQKFHMTGWMELIADLSRDFIHDKLRRVLRTILDPESVDPMLIQAKGKVEDGFLCERLRAQRIFDRLGDIETGPTLLQARQAVFEVYRDDMLLGIRQWIEGRFPSVGEVTGIWKPQLELELAMQGVKPEGDTHTERVSWFENRSKMKEYMFEGDARFQLHMRVIPELDED